MNLPQYPIDRRRFVRRLALGAGAAAMGPGFLAACGGDDDEASGSDAAAGGSPDSTGGTGTSSAGTPGTGASDGTITDVAIQLSWVKTVEFAGYFLADDRGFYADRELSVDLVAGGPNAPLGEQSVIGGGTQFGLPTFPNLVSAVQVGADLVTIGAQLQRNMAAFVSLPDNPVRELADLVGLRVGASNPAYEELFKNLLEDAGLPPDFTFVPVGADPSPLTEGDVDVYQGFENNQPLTLDERGIENVVLPMQDVGLPWYTGPVAVSRSYLEENRDIVLAFLEATVMGFELNAQDPAPGAELTAETYSTDQGLTVEKETASNEIYIEAQSSDITEEKGYFYMDLDYVAGPIYEGLAKYGLTDFPDPSSYIDMSLLDEIYDGRTSLL